MTISRVPCCSRPNHYEANQPLLYTAVQIQISKYRIRYRLVVEQTNVLLDKGNAQLLGGVEDGSVVLATARGGNVLGS